jgi:hypothetical protein
VFTAKRDTLELMSDVPVCTPALGSGISWTRKGWRARVWVGKVAGAAGRRSVVLK